MITKEKTSELIKRAYGIAKSHGFHERELSVEHMMMLVIGEVGEAVEADRRGKRADLTIADANVQAYDEWFKFAVKDTVDDELADVAIRLYDVCGTLGVEPELIAESEEASATMAKAFVDSFFDRSFVERCHALCHILTMATNESRKEYDGSSSCLPNVIGSALCLLDFIAKDKGVNLLKHIELKMRYNQSRPPKHGKRY